jgi:hypothetical protein
MLGLLLSAGGGRGEKKEPFGRMNAADELAEVQDGRSTDVDEWSGIPSGLGTGHLFQCNEAYYLGYGHFVTDG